MSDKVNGSSFGGKHIIVVVDACGRQMVGKVDCHDIEELSKNPTVIIQDPIQFAEQINQTGVALQFAPFSHTQFISKLPVHWVTMYEVTSSQILQGYEETLMKMNAARSGIHLATELPPAPVRRN